MVREYKSVVPMYIGRFLLIIYTLLSDQITESEKITVIKTHGRKRKRKRKFRLSGCLIQILYGLGIVGAGYGSCFLSFTDRQLPNMSGLIRSIQTYINPKKEHFFCFCLCFLIPSSSLIFLS